MVQFHASRPSLVTRALCRRPQQANCSPALRGSNVRIHVAFGIVLGFSLRVSVEVRPWLLCHPAVVPQPSLGLKEIRASVGEVNRLEVGSIEGPHWVGWRSCTTRGQKDERSRRCAFAWLAVASLYGPRCGHAMLGSAYGGLAAAAGARRAQHGSGQARRAQAAAQGAQGQGDTGAAARARA